MRVFLSLAAAAVVFFAGGSAQADTFTTNLLANPGAESGSISGWISGGNSNPGVDGGSFDPGINPHTGSYDFYGHTGDFGTLSQTVSLLTQGVTTSAINAGMVTADLSFSEQGLNQGSLSDDAEVLLTFLNSSGHIVGTANSGEVDSHNGTWDNFAGGYIVPPGAESVTYEMEFIRHDGSDNDSFLDDNGLVLDTAAATVTPSSVTPEPSSFLLLGTGLLGAVGAARRRWGVA